MLSVIFKNNIKYQKSSQRIFLFTLLLLMDFFNIYIKYLTQKTIKKDQNIHVELKYTIRAARSWFACLCKMITSITRKWLLKLYYMDSFTLTHTHLTSFI